MPTITTGMFFLARHKPTTDTTPDGAFRLTLYVRDKQSEQRVEPYVVRWVGNVARLWWQEHERHVGPGQPLALELVNPRAIPSSSPVIGPEIHATVLRCELAPVAPSWMRRAANSADNQARAA